MTIKFSDITGGGIPYGDNAGRPVNPGIGKLYSNGEAQRLELYTATGWNNIVQEVPGVSGVTGNYSEQTNSGTIIIQGTNFVSGAIVSVTGTNGVEIQASSTTFNSIVQLTSTFSGLSNQYEPYDVKVTNPSNLFGILPDALFVNASPVWQTPSGSLGTFTEQISITLSALSATDSDSTITYALASGSSLPSGITLNSSTGVISGTLPDISTNTTYTFTINATDGVNTIPRTFSFTSNAVAQEVEILVVAGGGGGGNYTNYRGAGGGAGGLVYIPSFTTSAGTYSISIGNGGAVNTNGQNTSISGNGRTLTAIGGGRGAENDGTDNASSGGSGGGSWYPGYAGKSSTQPLNTNDGITIWSSTGFGNKGGDSSGSPPYGGGGGGAGAAGGNWNGPNGPVGGIGKQYSITGTTTYYAGGGSSANYGLSSPYTEYPGGLGGGGTGSNDSFDPASNGSANTGGGGGSGGSGGSGVLVIAYPDTLKALTVGSGLTYDQPTRAGYRVYRFTAGSGTITF